MATQTIQIKRTETPGISPTALAPGELAVEMGAPTRLWVGVPIALDAAGQKLLVDGSIDYVNVTGDVMTGLLTLSGNPTAPLHAATKQYVDSVDHSMYLLKSGGTMTGFLSLIPDTPTFAEHAAHKGYVDTKVAKAGDIMTGFLTLNADPTAALHPATKQYVDARAGGMTEAAADAKYVNITGDTMSGALTVSAGHVYAAAGSILAGHHLYTGYANAASGNIYFGSDGTKILSFGGGNYTFSNGNVYAPTGTGFFGANLYTGYQNLNSGTLLFGQDGTKYLTCDGSNYVFQSGAVFAANGRLWGASDGAFSNYLPLNGSVAMTGQLTTAVAIAGIAHGEATGSLQVVSNTPTDPSISFHRQGAFATNLGMGADGNFWFGGWSHGASTWQIWSKRDFNYRPVSSGGDTMSGILYHGSTSYYFNVDGAIAASNIWASNFYAGGVQVRSDGWVIANVFQTAATYYMGTDNAIYWTDERAAGRITTNQNLFSHGYLQCNAHITAGSSINSGSHMNAGNGWYVFSHNTGIATYWDGTRISHTHDIYAPNISVGDYPGIYFHNDTNVRINFNGAAGSFFVSHPIDTPAGRLKVFLIDHPVDTERYLIHACLEGPTADAFYRGKSDLDGEIEIELPKYFTALCDEDTATVIVTPIHKKGDKAAAFAQLSATEVENGRFTVVCASGLITRFHWEVKAARKDAEQILVEPLRSEINVYGDGPYRHYNRKPQAEN